MYEKRSIAIGVSIYSLGVVLGIIIGITDTLSFCAIFSVLFVVSCVFCIVFSRFKKDTVKKYITATAFAVAALSLGILRISVYNHFVASNSVYDKKQDTVILKITEVNSNSLDCKILKSEIGVDSGEKIRLYMTTDFDGYIVGDYISAEITYQYKNDSSLYSDDISLTSYGYIKEYKEGNGILYSIRKSISDNSDIIYSSFGDSAAIAKGVTIGDRSDLDSYVYSIYRNAGISHILAISGLHLSIISLSIYTFFISVSAGSKVGSVVASVFAVAYVFLAGMTPGVVRAAVMLLFYMFPRLFFKSSDKFTSIFIALFILVFANPYSINSAGLQLSFVCSLGIMLTTQYISRINGYFSTKKYGKPKYKVIFYNLSASTLTTMATSFAASVFSFPILLLSFDTVSYCSPIMNILTIPLFSFAVTVSIIAFVVAPISTFLASLIAFPAGLVFEGVTSLSKLIFDLDVGVISSYAPLMFFPLLFSLLIIYVLVFVADHRERFFNLTAILFSISIVISGMANSIVIKDRATIQYGNTRGEYMVVSAEDNLIYVDLGGYSSNPKAVYKTGLTAVDSYVMLKYDGFSFKRLDYITGQIKVSKIYLPIPHNSNDNIRLNEIKELANRRNCDIIYFNDYFCESLLPKVRMEIFIDLESENLETILCVDVNGKKFRYLENEFHKSVNADVVIITDSYAGDFSKLKFAQCYATSDYIEDNKIATANCFSFKDELSIEIDISESDYNIYEP